MADDTFLPCENSIRPWRELQYKHQIYNFRMFRGRWAAGCFGDCRLKDLSSLQGYGIFCRNSWTVRYKWLWTAQLHNEKTAKGWGCFIRMSNMSKGWGQKMWQIAGKIIKPSSVASLLWFIFWRKTCFIISRKYQEACFVTHTNGPYFEAVAGHEWSKDSICYTGGRATTGSRPRRTGQRRWPRRKRIPCSSRLGAGRETDNLIAKPSKMPLMGLQNMRRSGCKENDFNFWHMETRALFKTEALISFFSK